MKNITVYIESGEGFHFPSTDYKFILLNNRLFIQSLNPDLGTPFYYVLNLKENSMSTIEGETDVGVWTEIGKVTYIGGI